MILLRRVTQYPPVQELKKYVVDYWSGEDTWELISLRSRLPHDVLVLLSAVSLKGKVVVWTKSFGNHIRRGILLLVGL